MSVPPKDQPTPEWLLNFKTQTRKLILCADYRAAYNLAEPAFNRWPGNFDIRYHYAKILGDWADEFSLKKKSRAKRKAAKILKPLTQRLRGKDAATCFSVCLNYYYQSQDFLAMCRYGRKLVKRRERKGHYALGLGATLQSFALLRVKKRSQAIRWARTGAKAWKAYGLKSESYYFPHYIYAMALAIDGQYPRAMGSLKRAACLSGKEIDDWEFQDVFVLIDPNSLRPHDG